MSQDWAVEHYRPTVLRLVRFFFRTESVVVRAPMLIGGLSLLFLPTGARERILFQKRNKDTRRIASGIPSHVHFHRPR